LAYPFTLDAWVKTTDTDTRALLSIAASALNFVKISLQTGSARAAIGNGGSSTEDLHTTVINDGDWHHVVGTFTSTFVECFVDGVSTGSPTANALAIPALTGTAIGADYNSLTVCLDGSIDEVRVWDSELSQADITALYNSRSGVLSRVLIDNDVVLASSKKPIHAWPCSKNEVSGKGTDIGTTGGINLTLNNTPTDEDGIPAGNVSGLIALVVDQSGNGNNLTQATLSMRPEVVRVADGTGYALKFDGVDDYLQSAAFAGALSQPNTIFLTVDITDNSADQGLIDGIAAASEQSLQVNSTGDLLRIDGGTAASTTIGADYGTIHTIIGLFSGAASEVFQDGGTGEVESAGAETMTGVTVGALQDGSLPAKGIYRQAVINDGAMTDEEMDEIGSELQMNQGLTWTEIA